VTKCKWGECLDSTGLACLLHQCDRIGAISTSRQMAWEPHLSEADNAECVVGVQPDNWAKIPIVGPAGACCTRLVQYAG
jgi:hypothetical protein